MMELPKFRLTLTEARDFAAACFTCSAEKAEAWLQEAIRSRKLNLWDCKTGRSVANVASYRFDWPRGEITKTTMRQTVALTEDNVDPPYRNHTDTREVRIERTELEDFMADQAEPPEPSAGAAPGKPGRTPTWDWEAATRFMMEMANSPDGLPESQAEIERMVSDWFVTQDGNHPAESTIRDFVRKRLPSNYRSSDS